MTSAFTPASSDRDRTVISQRVFDTPIDDVFDAYANPDKIVRWWGPGGLTLTTESLDLTEGGHWHFVFAADDGTTFENHIVFQTIHRPERFVVDHVSEPRYIGTVEFEELGTSTSVSMYWTFEDSDLFERIKDVVVAGNEGNFDRLGEVLAGHR